MQVDIIIAEESWSVGKLEAQNLYEDEREVLPEEEDDETNPDENEFEEVREQLSFTLPSLCRLIDLHSFAGSNEEKG